MERLQSLYDQLIALIPEEDIDRYLACGCSAGAQYSAMDRRLLIVEKLPKIGDMPHESGCCCDSSHSSNSSHDACGCGHSHSNASPGDNSHAHPHSASAHKEHRPFGGAVNSTDFSGAIPKLCRHLLGISASQWPECIAKTYLYKVAPMAGKPSSALLAQQHDLCGQILSEEIRVFDPTHVLFLTGWSAVWDFDFPIYPLLKGETTEAVGRAENGAHILVSRYAIRDSEDKFVSDIVAAFEALYANEA